MTKEEFETKLYGLLKENPDGVLLAQIPQKCGLRNTEEIKGESNLKIVLQKIPFAEISEAAAGKEKAKLKYGATPPTSEPIELDPTKINEKIKTLLPYLTQGLYEKEEAVRLALLCAVAGESIFFLGPPGTAKSMISRRIKEAFKGSSDTGKAEYFEYLMNEFSTPDEIFGTIKL